MARRFLSIMRHGGTHLVKPILKFTIGTSKGGKGPTLLTFDPASLPVVVCTRDPRNRTISSFRYKFFRNGAKPNGEDVDAMLADYIVQRGIVGFMLEWADRWMNWPGAHYIRFEDFLTEDDTVRTVTGVAEYDGKDISEDNIRSVWKQFYRKGHSYTGKHSVWADWFGPKATLAWESANGDLLVDKMGYK